MTVHSQRDKAVLMVDAQLVTDAQTVTANLDTRGAAWATIFVNFSAEEGTDATAASYSILTCDTTVASDFVTLQAIQTFAQTATGKLVQLEVDCRKHKRYLRLSLKTGTATGSNSWISAIGLLSRQAIDPENTSDMVSDTTDYYVHVL